MALLSGSLLLRVVSSDFRRCAATSGVGGLWLRSLADLASTRTPALRSSLIVFPWCMDFGVQLCEKPLEHTYPLWILRREHHGGVLCPGESKHVVHSGVRRVVRDGVALRLSRRVLAIRNGRGHLGGAGNATLEVGARSNLATGLAFGYERRKLTELLSQSISTMLRFAPVPVEDPKCRTQEPPCLREVGV